jgi:hypothetical protein
MSVKALRRRWTRSKEQRARERERERERAKKAKALTRSEIEKELREKLIVPLWPIAGMALGLSRPTTYNEAAKGNIPTTNVGFLKKVSSRWVLQKVGLDEAV